jgi:hypothetical protein
MTKQIAHIKLELNGSISDMTRLLTLICPILELLGLIVSLESRNEITDESPYEIRVIKAR